jgi:uncharacterized membrane protein YkvA (DUF1232 family)
VSLLPIDFLPWGLLLIATATCAAGVVLLVIAGRREDARSLAGFIPDCLVMIRRLLAAPQTPWRDRLLLGALLAYLASPIDLVPDFVPVAGQLDDAIVVGLVLRHVVRRHSEDRITAAWPGPESSLRVVLRATGAGG